MAAGTIRESKTILTAEDKTAGAFSSFTRNIQQAQGMASGLYGSLAALGSSAVIGGFAALVNKGLEAADAMNKMSQRTGIAVEELSQLSYAAKLADVSNEGLTKGIKGLSEMMVRANDATSIQAATMKALGVDIKGGLAPALDKIADQFAKLPDGATKTALAVDLFGKAGQDMIPLLNQGSDGIKRMKEEADALGLTISGKVAADAERFKDNMAAIGTGAEKTATTLATKMAAALADVSEAMKQAQKESGLVMAAFVGLGGVAAKLFTDDSLSDIEKTQKRMAELKDELAGVRQRLQDSMDVMGPWGEKLRASLIAAAGKGTAELKALNDELIRLYKAQGEAAEKKKADAEAKKTEEERIRQIKERFEAEKKAAADRKAWNEKLAKEDIKGWVAYADAVFAEADQLNKDLAKISEDYWANEQKMKDLDAKGWIAYIDATINEYERELTEAGKQQKSWHQTQIDEWKPFMDGIEGAFRDGFGRMLEGGKGWWKSFTQGLANTFKTTVADFLYQAFAKPLVLNIIANLAGATGLSGLASAANAMTGTGAGSQFLGLGGAGSSLFSTAGLFAAVAAGGYGLGSLGAGALGAGERGQKVGGITGMLGGGLLGAIIGKFTDPNGLAQRSADFGGGRSNYWHGGGSSAFGNFGITNDKWFSDADMLAKVQTFQTGLAAAENALAKYLTTDQIKKVTDALASSKNYNFGTEHGDFAGTLGQILKDRIDSIIAAVDPSLKKWLDAFNGTGDELAAYAETLLQVNKALGSDQVKGLLAQIPELTIDGLMAMKQAGESLADTFQRVVGDFLNAQNALNAAIGSRNPAFARDMVLGQRNAIGGQFASLIGQSYGADLASRMALDPQSFTGLGTEGMQLLAQWLGLQTTLEQLDAQLSGNTSQAVSDFTNTLINSASAMGGAISGLAAYLRGSLLSDLSPLNPQARYNEARNQYNANLTLAQGGNIDAIANFGSLRDQFLSASRAVNASSGQYNTDFFSTYNAGAALTGGQVRPYTAADGNANTAAIVAAVSATASGQQVTNTILVDYLNELANGNTAQSSARIVELLGMLNDRVRINGGALTSNSGALA